MGLVDPAAARIGAVEDDLEDAALLLPVLGRERARLLEFLEQDLHHALELALLGGRKMVDISAHRCSFPFLEISASCASLTSGSLSSNPLIGPLCAS